MPETVYRHTPDMREISGFGGGYEACCQDMLEAGVKWLNEHPDRGPLEGHSFKEVFGLMIPDSEDAKTMEKVVVEAAKGEATGAMHHAVMSRLFWISANGWDVYCAELRKADAGDDQ
jgi:hypothetical protein